MEGGAATSKQQDDINGQIELLKAQIMATESQKASVYCRAKNPGDSDRQVEDQMLKCTVRNPMDGILLTKYKEKGEIAVPGQALFKMADMDELILQGLCIRRSVFSLVDGERVKVRFDVARRIGGNHRMVELDLSPGGIYPQDYSDQGGTGKPGLCHQGGGAQRWEPENRNAG